MIRSRESTVIEPRPRKCFNTSVNVVVWPPHMTLALIGTFLASMSMVTL